MAFVNLTGGSLNVRDVNGDQGVLQAAGRARLQSLAGTIAEPVETVEGVPIYPRSQGIGFNFDWPLECPRPDDLYIVPAEVGLAIEQAREFARANGVVFPAHFSQILVPGLTNDDEPVCDEFGNVVAITRFVRI